MYYIYKMRNKYQKNEVMFVKLNKSPLVLHIIHKVFHNEKGDKPIFLKVFHREQRSVMWNKVEIGMFTKHTNN